MSEENKKPETEDGKSDFQKNLSKFWYVYVLGISGIIGAISNYKKLVDFLREIDIVHLSNLILIILGVIAFAGVIVAIIYMKKKTPAPNIALIFFLIAVLCGGLIAVQQKHEFNRILVVYDKYTIPYHAQVYDYVETHKLEELDKLEDSYHFNDKSVIISTVERPVMKWKQVLPSDSEIESPLLTLQEIIDESSAGFIDISFSDFDFDIANKIQQNKIRFSEVRVFYEYGYEPAERRLRNTLGENISGLTINSALYNPNSINSLLEPKSLTIFLGSCEGFTKFLDETTQNDYAFLIIPNWLRPSVPLSSNESSNRVCLVSTVYEKLVNKDYDTWKEIYNTINGDWSDSENLEDKILSNFATNNQLKEINF